MPPSLAAHATRALLGALLLLATTSARLAGQELPADWVADPARWAEDPGGSPGEPAGWPDDAEQPDEPTELEEDPADPAPAGPLGGLRLVTWYGNPLAGQMGVLGQYPPDEVVRRLRQVADAYQELSDRPVQPALHLVATVAQASPGPAALYRLRMSDELIEEWAQLAESNDLLLILDLQIGRSDVLSEVEAMRPWLERPHVHLALDPEFAMGPTEAPGQQIGSLDAWQINQAQEVLAGIVAAGGLPNKLLIVHQFLDDMITNKADIASHPLVDVVIDMDGFGGRGAKLSKYARHVRDFPVEFAGIKLFYDYDVDLLAPADVMGLDPVPDVIIYQ